MSWKCWIKHFLQYSLIDFAQWPFRYLDSAKSLMNYFPGSPSTNALFISGPKYWDDLVVTFWSTFYHSHCTLQRFLSTQPKLLLSSLSITRPPLSLLHIKLIMVRYAYFDSSCPIILGQFQVFSSTPLRYCTLWMFWRTSSPVSSIRPCCCCDGARYKILKKTLYCSRGDLFRTFRWPSLSNCSKIWSKKWNLLNRIQICIVCKCLLHHLPQCLSTVKHIQQLLWAHLSLIQIFRHFMYKLQEHCMY